MKKRVLYLGVGMLFLCVSAFINSAALAQDTENCFRGTVKDANGAVIVGARVV